MKKILSLLILCLTTGFTNAAVIWDNGAPNPGNNGALFSEVGSIFEADDFTLATNETLRSVEFWGTHWSTGVEPATEIFTVSIYADNVGNVGALVGTSALLLINKTDTGFDHNALPGANILDFQMDLVTPIPLPAGTYWFSVVSNDNPGTSFAWQESGADGAGNFQSSNDSGATWGANTNILSFNLSNNFIGSLTPSAQPVPTLTEWAIFLLILSLGFIGFRMTTKNS